MTEEAKRYGTELLQTRSALETSKLDVGQKNAMIEQLTRDRDAERTSLHQEREQLKRSMQAAIEEVRGVQKELVRARDEVSMLRRDLDQKNEQIAQVTRRIEEARGGNPMKFFPW